VKVTTADIFVIIKVERLIKAVYKLEGDVEGVN